MTALLILSIVLSTGALVFLWLFLSKVSEIAKKIEESENAIGYIKAVVNAQRQIILYLSASVAKLVNEKESDSGLIKEITYDPKKKTVNIAGNLVATGWVTSGGIKKED